MKFKFLFGNSVYREADPDKESAGTTSDSDKQADDKSEDSDKSADDSNKQTDSKSADSEKPADPGLSIKDVLEAIKALQQSDKEPEKEPEKESDKEPKKESDSGYEATLRKMLIRQANVPEELMGLLPADIKKLGDYLESDAYMKLAKGLKVISEKQPPTDSPTVKPAPKDKPKTPEPPKTFKDVNLDHLRLFDAF